MNADKVREVLNTYRKKFEELGVPKQQFPHNELPKSDNDFLAHCHGMLDEDEKPQPSIEALFLFDDSIVSLLQDRWRGMLK